MHTIDLIRVTYNLCSDLDGYDSVYDWSWSAKFCAALNSEHAYVEMEKLWASAKEEHTERYAK